jgi:hypothetical protein
MESVKSLLLLGFCGMETGYYRICLTFGMICKEKDKCLHHQRQALAMPCLKCVYPKQKVVMLRDILAHFVRCTLYDNSALFCWSWKGSLSYLFVS